MNQICSILGIIGTICLSFSGLPQAIKSIRDGHSNGMSHGTVILWLVGELAMLIYAMYYYLNDMILILNYTSNFVLVFIIFKYKYFIRK